MAIVERWRKRPLEVEALRFPYGQEDHIHLAIWKDYRDAGATLSFRASGWRVHNPGSDQWLPLTKGCYIVIAPTGCRYPVSAEQFERNYERA